MRKVEFLIDEKYASLMSITLVGGVSTPEIRVATGALEIGKDCKFLIEGDGTVKKFLDEEI